MGIPQQLEARLREAARVVLPDADTAGLLVRPCADKRFGDYQTSGLMPLAKARGLDPRKLAAEVCAKLDVRDLCDEVTAAGQGFINFRLKPAALVPVFEAAARGEHLFFDKATVPRTVVVDYSSPNVAKPMHVGHIRSTIIGDSIARILRLLGHRVITDNHIGDWGTQFGMLLLGWKRYLNPAALESDPIAEMERVYKLVNAECEKDPATLQAARAELVKLQRGDPENRRLWEQMVTLSRREFDRLYARLDVQFDYTLGESFYNPRLEPLVNEFVARGIARESEGAIVVFFDEPADAELRNYPLIIRKSDGAFNYATTDLATLVYRIETWRPDEIIYVTDARQKLHFAQVFAAFRRFMPEARVRLAHVWFGTILGEDGKPFRTRAGDTVKLADLLDEAEERALKIVTEKNPSLPEAQRREIARVVGIGAVKYADLMQNRETDYVFRWDKLLALDGNTAPYLQYAYTRIASIFRKGQVAQIEPRLVFEAPEELALAKHMLNFGLVLENAANEYRPNFICNFLYELAVRFSAFYENCPVLQAPEPLRLSRLTLCHLAAQILKTGLGVLGIRTLEQM
ncbi:MAG: arginine--tRNA ligase [Verrucomicrobiae bacterium]|nr:arginine--tRNA ligase [Verrucomicrobiae bacterium]